MYTTHPRINIAINRFRWLLHFLLKNSRTTLTPFFSCAAPSAAKLHRFAIGIVAKLRLMRESAIIILRYTSPLTRARWMVSALMRDDTPENNPVWRCVCIICPEMRS